MVKHIQISFTPKEFAFMHLLMKQKYDELLTFGYNQEMDVEQWKAFNRAMQRMNGANEEFLNG